MKRQDVLDKKLSLDEVMDYIDRILVGEGRQIEVAENNRKRNQQLRRQFMGDGGNIGSIKSFVWSVLTN